MANESLLESRYDLAEHKPNQWFATVPEGVEPNDLFQTAYWSHVAYKLRPMDEIIVTNDACAWRIHLLVEDAWQVGARVAELGRHSLAPLEQPETEHDLRIQWRGPHSKWCVVRRDGVLIKDKMPTRELAMQHMTAMATERVA